MPAPIPARTVALVPLRGGSKGIPMKNIKLLGGKPLCAWVLEAAAHCPGIDAVYVSTDSELIRETVLGLGLGIYVIDRPAQYATDDASTESVMLHFVENVPCERLITIQATSPLLTSENLKAALLRFDADNCDSMLSAVRTRRFFWSDGGVPINYNPQKRPRRQDFPGTLMENGAFYITRSRILLDTGCRLGGTIGIHEMPENTAVEIDDPEDWEDVSRLLDLTPSRAG